MTRYVAAVILLLLPFHAGASTLCVNTGGTGGCFASIQQAVDAAALGDSIDVAAGTFNENVLLSYPKRIAIHGAGATDTLIHGDGTAPVVSLAQRTLLTLSGVGIEGGTRGIEVDRHASLSVSDCAIANNGNGIEGTLNTKLAVTRCTITGNGPLFGGAGGISTNGDLTVVSSTVSGNSGTLGGIYSSKRLTLTDSAVSNNQGPGLELYYNATIRGSTISGNTKSGIRCLANSGQVKISDSTISGNSSVVSGGLEVDNQRASLDHVTVANNSASDHGGGILTGPRGKVSLTSSIVAGNTAPTGSDCSSNGLRLAGTNLIENTSGCVVTGATSNLIVADPLLGPLQDNGGPTETQALLAGSPALSVVTTRSACRHPDQRGVPRTVPCDLGAYEAP